MQLGVNVHPLHDEYASVSPAQLLDRVQATGATMVRLDIHWAWIESQRPGQENWNAGQVQRLNAFLDEAASRHIQVLATVTEAPAWASIDPTSDYAAFLGRLVPYADGRIQYWEIWNEPNAPGLPFAHDPAGYARLLAGAYGVVKGVDPSALVIGGALAPRNPQPGELSTLDYVEGMYAAGAAANMDRLSIHPYTDGNPPNWSDSRWSMNSFGTAASAIHDAMLRAGDTRTLVISELGWTTVGQCANCWTPTLPTSEADQATFLAQATAMAQMWGFVDALIAYELVDRGNTTSSDFEDHFGLFRRDLSAKPAAVSLSHPQMPPSGTSLPAQGCPPANNQTITTPTDVPVNGPAIVHPWWNNGRPSFGQRQVRVELQSGESGTVIQMMGLVYQYANTPACRANLDAEFANASELPVRSLGQLQAEGLIR
jgi:hypothetical protein